MNTAVNAQMRTLLLVSLIRGRQSRMMLKLTLQYFGHLMQRADSLEETPTLRKIEGKKEGDNRGQDGWMALLTRWT